MRIVMGINIVNIGLPHETRNQLLRKTSTCLFPGWVGHDGFQTLMKLRRHSASVDVQRWQGFGGFHSHGGTPIAGWSISWKIP